METGRLVPPHPFPARMAPEIALRAIRESNVRGTVLDPMCGSGTVLKAAVLNGRPALGFDADPLAVLMSRVWSADFSGQSVGEAGKIVLAEALELEPQDCPLPWIDKDPETERFINYWFAPQQAAALRSLAFVLQRQSGVVTDAVRLAMSRLIVTKERGASLARDVSHSRPHRVADSNDFNVFRAFEASVARLAQRLSGTGSTVSSLVRIGDARRMESVESESVAQVITSPPYLNAIDYLRGHKLALVWFGYTVGQLRSIRADSIGAERSLPKGPKATRRLQLIDTITDSARLPERVLGILNRYVRDMEQFVAEAYRVLAPGGEIVLVIGNATMRNVYIDNAKLLCLLGQQQGLVLADSQQRALPHYRRYLPPPTAKETSALAGRMRSETILRFVKQAVV